MMKKLFTGIVISAMMLTGCGSSEKEEPVEEIVMKSIAETDFTTRQAQKLVDQYLSSDPDYSDAYEIREVEIKGADVVATFLYGNGTSKKEGELTLSDVKVNAKDPEQVEYGSIQVVEGNETASDSSKSDKDEEKKEDSSSDSKSSDNADIIDFDTPSEKPSADNPEDTNPKEIMSENNINIVRVYAYQDGIWLEGSLSSEGKMDVYILDLDKKVVDHPVALTSPDKFNEKANVEAGKFYYIYMQADGNHEMSWALSGE